MKFITLYLVLVAIWWAIVFKLIQLGHMKTLLLILALMAWQCPAASAQSPPAEGTPIASTRLSGMDDDRLSPGLRRDIRALVGTPLDENAVRTLAARIEGERPGAVVATRTVSTADGRARVIFLVATRGADVREGDTNVNARYAIERVEIDGVADSRLSQPLRDDLQALVGKRFAHRDVERLLERVRRELPGFDVSRSVKRGDERGQLRLVVVVRPGESMRWLPFTRNRSALLFHADQGWSGMLDANIGSRNWRVTPFGALSQADDLIEEYSGGGVRVETRHVGTERLGAAISIATFDVGWREATTAAATDRERLYDRRTTVSPTMSVALTKDLRIRGGVSITELGYDDETHRSANAYVFGAEATPRWTGALRHDLSVSADVRRGVSSLQSDFTYTSLHAAAIYKVRSRHQTLVASAEAGGVTSTAPLFEQFTLGDTRTLRGWDKYAIAPLGGNRVQHASMEYAYRSLTFLLDSGAIWRQGDERTTRVSTGVGVHHDGFFATLAFPLNTDDVRTVFMAGVRF
ncbi:MAG: BamA/TamA family outer membrane protein [Vicinamibacterales bacterium]